jgi:hypothetical protein
VDEPRIAEDQELAREGVPAVGDAEGGEQVNSAVFGVGTRDPALPIIERGGKGLETKIGEGDAALAGAERATGRGGVRRPQKRRRASGFREVSLGRHFPEA